MWRFDESEFSFFVLFSLLESCGLLMQLATETVCKLSEIILLDDHWEPGGYMICSIPPSELGMKQRQFSKSIASTGEWSSGAWGGLGRCGCGRASKVVCRR